MDPSPHKLREEGGKKRERFQAPYTITIEGISVGNPQDSNVSQKQAEEWVQKIASIVHYKDRISSIYKNTSIRSRYLANPDFHQSEFDPSMFSFYPKNDRLEPQPSIEYRLTEFNRHAIPLVDDVVGRLLDDTQVDVKTIGKIVYVSSTGIHGPSLECHVINKFNLPRNCERSTVVFMGCAAAMNGMHIAMDYVKCHPSKKALVICLELSSVHGGFGDNMNDIVIHSLFADGCAAVLLSANVDKMSLLTTNSEDGISLDITNSGITCTLSRNLPKYIEDNVNHFVTTFLERNGYSIEDVGLWAIHPGGTKIIEAVEKSLGLERWQTALSWYVLNNYGNMLSPSILFVLYHYLIGSDANETVFTEDRPLGIAFSFSPGVGIEGILFERLQ